jgi:hypothetical protein
LWFWFRSGDQAVVEAGGFRDVEEDNFQKKVRTTARSITYS